MSCNMCDTSPIYGRRLKCPKCTVVVNGSNVPKNYCSECYDRGNVCDHSLEEYLANEGNQYVKVFYSTKIKGYRYSFRHWIMI